MPLKRKRRHPSRRIGIASAASSCKRAPILLALLVCFLISDGNNDGSPYYVGFCVRCNAFVIPMAPSSTRTRPHFPSRLSFSVKTPSSPDSLENRVALSNNSSSVSVRQLPFFYSSSQLQQIKDSVNIVDVIEQYALREFKRIGPDRATAVCPFHDDHNPSLSVDNKRRIYKCFSCGVGGDVFHFVKTYANQVQGQDQPMSFGQAVKHVLSEFGDSSNSPLIATTETSGRHRLSPEELQQQEMRKKRVLLANAAAGAYYFDQLIQPTAGTARQYLLERYLTPAAVKTFALGFAPDRYFHSRSIGAAEATKKDDRTWGHGSLTQHLLSLNFTANELVQAGLALPTQWAQQQQQKRSMASSANKTMATTKNTAPTIWASTDIMDRFRGRLVVPIMDAAGRHILAFGGRLLPTSDEVDRIVGQEHLEDRADSTTVVSPYKPPKYLNSPESIVFEKKLVLFGYHVAQRALKLLPTTTLTTRREVSVVVVEGYMDVISLWTAGIETAVATMGTAISMEQLQAAAKLETDRIVLCLDNDTAGEAAVERLCTNGFFKELATQHKHIQLQVATLPGDMKDPADFVEHARRRGTHAPNIGKKFQSKVLDASVEWTAWFLQRILAKYDPVAARGVVGSFGYVFEQVAGFMADSMSPAERTQCSLDVANSLGNILAKERNTTEVSEMVLMQLESDLLDLSSRMAATRESIQRRTQEFGTDSSSILATFARGSGPESLTEDTTSKLARNVTLQTDRADTDADADNLMFANSGPKPRTFRAKGSPKIKSLTPHFAGFRFAHDTDATWLGIDRRKPTDNLVLGRPPKKWRPLEKRLDYDNDPSILAEKVVYFASNQYHGGRFLTDEAALAGYSDDKLKPDPAFVEKGVGVFLQQDVQMIREASEDTLLRCLVQHSSVRTSVKNSLEARRAVHSDTLLDWSCPSREWMFRILTDESGIRFRTPQALRDFLASLGDCPDGAFFPPGTVAHVPAERQDGSRNQFVGSLEPFFLVAEPSSTDSLGFEGSDLQAHASLASLLWASTVQRMQRIQRQLLYCEKEMESSTRSTQNDTDVIIVPKLSGSMNQTHNQSIATAQHSLVQELSILTRSLRSLTVSSRHIQEQLLDQTGSVTLEGHLSIGLQKQLAVQLDDHLNRILNNCTEVGDALDSIERLDREEESYEDGLDRLANEWGEWYDDDYYWSPEDAIPHPVAKVETIVLDDDDGEENLQETLERIDLEWANWQDSAG